MESGKGRKDNQKMKPYLVYQYLLRNSDENHMISAPKIVGYLQELGIYAERRSIYKDIEAINNAIWLLENSDNIDLEDGLTYAIEEAKEDGTYYESILYDSHKKGFYVSQRKYDATDIRLISECIYSSKYISQTQAERLVNIMKEFVSDKQASEIRTEALVTNRVRTLNKNSLGNVSQIYDAMNKMIDGEKHIPEKITFQYLKYDINNLDRLIERRKGLVYKVSPYKLIINDGNYYLLAYDDYSQDMRTYRVDRMKNIIRTGEPREGKEAFIQVDLKSYTQRTFGMFNGEKERVRIRFASFLFDTAIERFGRDKSVYYSNLYEYNFMVV
ncbi:MAG: WYL domain-containing protein, partial [Eubacterium sp.]|nr:WYL domain-containing protein [Eubacterium sp.]